MITDIAVIVCGRTGWELRLGSVRGELQGVFSSLDEVHRYAVEARLTTRMHQGASPRTSSRAWHRCSEPGCDTRTYGKGLCQRHYMRMWSRDRTCNVPGCELKAWRSGKCKRHKTASAWIGDME